MDFDIIFKYKGEFEMKKVLLLFFIIFSVNSFCGFLQVDPGIDYDKNDPMSFNLYTYVRNNPVNATDPTGAVQVDKKGNVKFWRTGIGKSKFMNKLYFKKDGVLVTITWKVVSGYIKADDGTKIKASKALTGMKVKIQGKDGKVIKTGGKEILAEYVSSMSDSKNYDNTTDCHGTTFAKGQVWINNDQVANLVKGDNYKLVEGNPEKGDVGIYTNVNKDLRTSQHSVKVHEINSINKYVTSVESKGGITPFAIVPPGPGPGTGWPFANTFLNFYRK